MVDLELRRTTRTMDRDRIRPLIAPRILHPDLEEIQPLFETNRYEVMDPIWSDRPTLEYLSTPEELDRLASLALDPNIDLARTKDRAVDRAHELDPRTCDEGAPARGLPLLSTPGRLDLDTLAEVYTEPTDPLTTTPIEAIRTQEIGLTISSGLLRLEEELHRWRAMVIDRDLLGDQPEFGLTHRPPIEVDLPNLTTATTTRDLVAILEPRHIDPECVPPWLEILQRKTALSIGADDLTI